MIQAVSGLLKGRGLAVTRLLSIVRADTHSWSSSQVGKDAVTRWLRLTIALLHGAVQFDANKGTCNQERTSALFGLSEPPDVLPLGAVDAQFT